MRDTADTTPAIRQAQANTDITTEVNINFHASNDFAIGIAGKEVRIGKKNSLRIKLKRPARK